MLKMQIRVLLITLISLSSYAAEKYYNNISYTLGMVNHSVTPNESALVSTDSTVQAEDSSAEAASAAVSTISFKLDWEFQNSGKKSYFLSTIIPVMTSQGTGVYSGSVGMNFYFGDLGTKYTFSLNGKTMTFIPKTRYYWGFFTGPGYVVYNTESAKYTDVFFDLGLHLGGIWAWGKDKGYKAEAGLSRATGINTSGIKMNLFFGITQYL